MSGLLKEALKSLCGLNHWSYAVFWKIGCQSSKLLTWDEHYYEPSRSAAFPCISQLRNPELPFGEWEGCWGSETYSRLGSQPSDKVDLLINKMMKNNCVKIVGQGLVGRAAFTGNHRWILAKNYITDAHPLEVLGEVHLQFSAGMQTVVVIPVLPHGVIQLGSSISIMENPGFVNEVKRLILNSGCIRGDLLPNNYGKNECVEKTGISISMDSKCTRADLVPKKESMDDYLFQALHIPVHLAGDNMPFHEPLPSAIHDFPMHESENSNVKHEDPCVLPPSTDDLFDMLGEDLKSKLLIEKQKYVSADGPDIKMHNVVQNTFSGIFSAKKGTPNRRRLKPRENTRPMPKDRQMILDRVNELREIIPNAGKCSIATLLEKTVKHMLFLQSITKHADNLKLMGESKIKEEYEGGTTRAFEVGSQSMICPIVVEDLNSPRQMLVEMLCEERGFFLEIVDLIRGLGLTILKGVMETRKNKMWARFAVEANRDVTRVEIFMSLVHLLEQTAKGGTSSANMVVHRSFPLPATGGG
ncbi:hypothetical protein HRI_001099800 [Hibiscus trionum]|uniref:BHLH domain-containing protein n=1 Tax=Hibiscus trionum TaxID=183268 RepID=A0A9W7HEH3_HIBTR|nr:hypothetical protein HRI_001099800 [Hibiscus trionum]